MKRSELKRKSPLKREAAREPRQSWTTLGKKRLKVAEQQRRKGIRDAVYARDGCACRLAVVEGAGACFGPLTPHHVVKSVHGGPYDESNLVAACAHHNGLVESDADFAAACRKARLNLRSWEK